MSDDGWLVWVFVEERAERVVVTGRPTRPVVRAPAPDPGTAVLVVGVLGALIGAALAGPVAAIIGAATAAALAIARFVTRNRLKAWAA